MRFEQSNWLFDEVMPSVKPGPFKVISAIARMTWGWKKDEAKITLSEFQKMTGIANRTNLSRCIQAALDSGFVKREEDKNSFIYRLANGTETVPVASTETVPLDPEIGTETVPIEKSNGTETVLANGTETVLSSIREEKEEREVITSLSDKPEYQEFLDSWKRYFPNKPQPRLKNKKLSSKFRTRANDSHFSDNWNGALCRASKSDFCNSGGWFTASWFLKNDENYEKCLDGNYDNEPSKNGQQEVDDYYKGIDY